RPSRPRISREASSRFAVSFDLDSYLARRRAHVEQALDRMMPTRPAEQDPGKLVEAMRYAVMGGGKRLRPILALAAYEACGGGSDESAVFRAACAVELVHCYSLVHADLPAMDDDALRRGRPTVHVAFGEATAILVGDALLTLAFEGCADLCRHTVKVLAQR